MAITQAELRAAVLLWRADIEKAQHQIAQLQAICTHEDVGRRPYRLDDYAGPSEYKYDCKCLDCGKVWVEDQ